MVVVVVVVAVVVVVVVVIVDIELPSTHQKMAQNPQFLAIFDLEMCFVPHRPSTALAPAPSME